MKPELLLISTSRPSVSISSLPARLSASIHPSIITISSADARCYINAVQWVSHQTGRSKAKIKPTTALKTKPFFNIWYLDIYLLYISYCYYLTLCCVISLSLSLPLEAETRASFSLLDKQRPGTGLYGRPKGESCLLSASCDLRPFGPVSLAFSFLFSRSFLLFDEGRIGRLKRRVLVHCV